MSCGGRGRGRGHHEPHGHHEHHEHHGHHGHHGHHEHRGHHGHHGHHEHRGHHGHHGHRDHSPEGKPSDWCQTTTTTFTIPSEVSNPVIQPTIPYVGPIAGGIRPGTRLHVQGTVHPNAKEFQINFKTGINNADDVVFHFNPRIGQYVYMNIFKSGKWQKEELGPEKPFVRGASFKLLFLVNKDCYEVHVNGQHLYSFKHRLPLESVTTLGIVGDVVIHWLGFEDWKQTTTTTFTIPSEVSNPVIQPTIPYVGPIAGGIRPGTRLHVQGTVHPNAKEFQINFKTGINNADDVVFHFNPRIGQYVYMNIFKSGKWQKEELGPEKPFVRGASFKLLFLVNKDCYEVHVNGQHLYSFKHRLPLESVTTLGIVGDVVIHWLGFEDWKQTTTTTFTIPSEVSNPVIQPTIPYVGPIAGGIRPGTRLHVQGTVHPNAKEFQINFKTGINNADDVVFHFNPRIGQYVYMNIFKSGKWQKEELGPEKPFVRGASFKLLFLVNKDCYEVHVNGQHLYSFKHRLPLESVTTLGIVGDVVIHWLGFEDWKQTTTTTFTIPSEVSNPVIQPTIPYVGPIAGGIRPGTRLHVQGTVHPNAKEFQINFKTGINNADDVVFHFNPRIGQYVYMNIFKSGKWQKEELGPEKPFVRGASFKLLFLVNKDCYEVHVNGQHLYSFKHRLPLESVTTLGIVGDVVIHWLGFEDWKQTTTTTFTIPSEVSDPVIQPTIPYVGPIAGGIRPGTRLHVQGTVHPNAKEFQINFKTGINNADDVVFHFNPRIGQYVYMNIFKSGKWQKEELGPEKPFVRGASFKLLFLVNKDCYEVHVNGQHLYSFKHRLPLESVTTLGIVGDVVIHWLGFEKWTVFKEKKTLLMGTGSWTFVPLEICDAVCSPALPYVGGIPGGLKRDKAIVFQGTVPAHANCFAINFKTGPSDGDDIAFHYNPRFGDITALNSFRKGTWETQENAPDKPFTKGGAFIILVVINSEAYEVFVNGFKHCTFKHRIALEKVSTVNVCGDVSLLVWGFIDSWSTTSSFKELKTITSTPSSVSSLKFSPSEISHPVINTTLPYVGKVPGGLHQDRALFLQGMVPANANGFAVNFKTGPSDGDDIAFHYNPRIGDITALNSFRNGTWETQENAPDKPFTKGEAFQMIVPINSEGYEVYVNGLRQCGFKHRIPFEKVSALEIHGDLSQLIYGFIHGWSTSSVFTELQKFPVTETLSTIWGSTPFQISYPIRSSTLPHVGKIPGGIKQDMAVFVQGTLPSDAKSFAVNFKTGPSDGDDIAFHYNPRIGDITALNSFRNGTWETQENAPDKPFTKGEAFQMIVPINSEGYEVYVNGLRQCGFKHRIPLENVSALEIHGDLSQLIYGFIHGWSTSSVFKELQKFPVTETLSTIWGSTPFQISYPIRSSALPHVGKIPGGIKQDMAVFIQGTLPSDAKSFAVNFKTGPSDGDDIAFHYNPRIGDITALNSFRNGTWETQENAPDKPFTKGEAFQMIVPINSEGYEVYVNGLRQCGFKHRIPFEKVSALEIHGDLSQLIYGFIHGWSTSSVFTELQKFPVTETLSTIWGSTPFQISYPIRSSTLPHVGKIPGGIKQDMAVFVQGTLPSDAKSFAINFKTGPSDGDDIAFHYNPRIGDITALNSFRNGTWETQENAPDKPFTKGEAFQMIVPINSEGYEVYVNGLRQCGFKHRIPLENVSALEIHGDLSQLIYGFIHGWSTSSVFTELQKFPVTETLSTIWGSTPFQISYPVRSPALPHVGKIPGGIKQDMAVFVQGTLPSDTKSFAVNFKTGPSDGDDIAFHYNPRIGDITALNSFRNGTWETQENAPDKPFTKGEAFQMIVPINSEGYEVYVNGLRQCGFKHRIPFENVSALEIHGDLSQLIYGFIHTWSTSSVFKELQKIPVTETLSTIWGSTPFQISYPIRSSTLPHVGKIPGGIKQDMAVFVQGTLPSDAKSFAVNFKTGPSDGDDIAFHYNPRIGDITALNSFRNGTWETQENAPDKPFTKGEAFQMIVPINSEGYEVYVNGLRQCGFKHRIPFENVSALEIHGDLSQLIYGFIHGWSTSSVFTELQKFPVTETLSTIWGSTPFQISYPIRSSTLPHVGKIPGGIKQDMAVFVQGTLPSDAKSFAVNFKTGPSDGDDIAFHYNPRIGDITALNSFRNGTWETQENAPDKPFTKGEAFQMIVPINSEGYEVYVNGLRQCGFKHRIPFEKVSALEIHGDLSQLIYGFIHGWSTSSVFTELQKFPVTETLSTIWGSTPFQISYPIRSSTLPHVGKIPGGIKQDMAVFVQGTLPSDAKSFAVNFKTGPSDGDDIAFHYNPRIGDITALNSFRNGTWETQENAPDKPFTKGEAFQMIVPINSEGYEVYVNGLRQCGFKHRIPFEKVSALEIHGDLSQLIYGFIHGWSTSSVFTELQKFPVTETLSTIWGSTPFQISYPVRSPALPHVGKIPGGIKQDMAVFVQGTLPSDAKSFAINFKTGPSDGDDIAFHYNPRIGDITALNSFRNGTWETQENAPDKPFTKGEAFQMIVPINSEGYEVYVNGLRQCGFKHRIPFENVSALEIHGDLSQLIYGFIHSWSTSSFFKELQKFPVTESLSTPFQISHPISNPTLPYVGKIPGGIKQDMAVFFQGTLPSDAKSFAVNFKTGPSDGDDIAFHYNPRIGDITALNSFRNGTWETQENAPDKPFTKGEAFQMIVPINSEGYEVYVNGLRQCGFKHRIPFENVSALEIHGDLSLLICGFIHGWSTSSFFTELQKISVTESLSTVSGSTPFQISHPISNPTLPHVGKIPGGIKQDMAVFFQGTLPSDAKRFAINFKTGPSDGDDIAFHYNPRIGDITALNSFRNGTWETQENAPDKPFTKGEAFQIIIPINSEGYEVYVNGLRQCGFKHRIPFENVSALEIHGDLSLLIYGFIHSWSTSSFFTELQKISVTEISSTTSESATFQISHPIINPELPYGCKIPVGIKQNMAVIFQGTFNPDGKRFAIDFTDGKDVAFHYNPRLGQYTALNSFRNGNWDPEENAPDKPFTAGEAFQIIVAMKSEGYQVYVNTVNHCTFKHRMPLEKVSAINIHGDITIQLIGFIENWTIG
ncbi:uncharacterized protein lgals4 isoform X2 [Hemibagrus wyckioides]|uniref:uncharacterized protein lgals4 isoform X2 n=1 Tax=Hemibagrus wyckioides TaxID=337641 RepID=UPI00266B7B1D|nr:uncharacterized protein lgals4 isoform X2 [Hemibagrus wyckioides]